MRCCRSFRGISPSIRMNLWPSCLNTWEIISSILVDWLKINTRWLFFFRSCIKETTNSSLADCWTNVVFWSLLNPSVSKIQILLRYFHNLRVLQVEDIAVFNHCAQQLRMIANLSQYAKRSQGTASLVQNLPKKVSRWVRSDLRVYSPLESQVQPRSLHIAWLERASTSPIRRNRSSWP